MFLEKLIFSGCAEYEQTNNENFLAIVEFSCRNENHDQNICSQHILNNLQIVTQMLSRTLTRMCQNFAQMCKTPLEAIEGIKDGSLLLVGGFGLCGVPMNLVHAIRESKVKDLTIASNNCGYTDQDVKNDWGLAILLRTRQIKRMISSFVGENIEFERQYFCGELELEICPQGTLAEKIRSGGAGVPAFYTPTGVDTIIETGGFPIKYKYNGDFDAVKKGKIKPEPEIVAESRKSAVFKGRKYILEDALFGDFSLIKAKRADTQGNLQFQMTERNFNQDMAKAAKCVVAEVEEIVEAGQLDPENIHVPGVYVDRVFLSDPNCEWSHVKIEKLSIEGNTEVKKLVSEKALREGKIQFNPCNGENKTKNNDPIRLKIAKRAAQEVKSGMNINLGIGIPVLLPNVLPPDVQIFMQSENGIIGVGPRPTTVEEATGKRITAGKEPVKLNPGGSYFSSSESFSIIRGGHLDMTMLGAMEVSEDCDIANWMIPGKMMKGMGGAMDLVACGSKVVVLMEHSAKSKDGKVSHKLLEKCKLPLTAKGVVSKVITELAVFENINGKLVLTEIAEETTLQDVQKQTAFKITAVENLKRF